MIKTIGDNTFFAEVSSKGGTVTRFVCDGKEIIFPERPVGDKFRGGIPICFPFFGEPPENFSGMPKHGWLRNQELEVTEKLLKEVTFCGRNTATEQYPWQLEYHVTAAVYPKYRRLAVWLIVRRIQDRIAGKAPLNPAFHPYFSNLGGHVATNGNNVITKFSKESKKIQIEEESTHINLGKINLKMILIEGFRTHSCLTLWSDDVRKYFCVEPVLTHPRDFNMPRGEYLDVGEKLQMVCAFQIL